jgi:hypothetical protein
MTANASTNPPAITNPLRTMMTPSSEGSLFRRHAAPAAPRKVSASFYHERKREPKRNPLPDLNPFTGTPETRPDREC